jgi:hypothetical protein
LMGYRQRLSTVPTTFMAASECPRLIDNTRT